MLGSTLANRRRWETSFYELLESDSGKSRERAVYFFSKVLKQDSLLDLLNRQFTKGKYFYNVVTWIDRILYAPEHLRRVFRRKLGDEVAKNGDVRESNP